MRDNRRYRPYRTFIRTEYLRENLSKLYRIKGYRESIEKDKPYQDICSVYKHNLWKIWDDKERLWSCLENKVGKYRDRFKKYRHVCLPTQLFSIDKKYIWPILIENRDRKP